METNNDLENELRAAFPDLYDDVPPVSYDIETGDSDSLENEEVSSENSIIGNNEVEDAEYENITDTPQEPNYPPPTINLPHASEVAWQNFLQEVDTTSFDPLDLNTPEEEDVDTNNNEVSPIDWSGTGALGESNRRVIEEGIIEEENIIIPPDILAEYTSAPTSNEVDLDEEEPVEELPAVQEEARGADVPIQYSRFKGADWFTIAREQEVILAGLGGIGSWTNIFLSRLGLKELILFDSDVFESHNMSGQAVTRDDVGKNKAAAAADKALAYSNYETAVFNRFYRKEDNPITTKVMICGFDNMKARKEYYEMWKQDINADCPQDYLFIDGRLTAELFQVFVIKGNDKYAQEEYEINWLFGDDIADETDCTFKQTTHLAAMIASFIVNHFVNWCSSFSETNFPRRIPWFTEYNSILNVHNYEY